MANTRKLLIVEDDPSIRNVHTVFFELQGFEIDTVGEGNMALPLVKTNDYDVVVLDLGLPDTDGLDVLKAIRSFSAVPVLVITARTDLASINASMANGATEYINKPFRPDALLRRINALTTRTAKGGLSGR